MDTRKKQTQGYTNNLWLTGSKRTDKPTFTFIFSASDVCNEELRLVIMSLINIIVVWLTDNPETSDWSLRHNYVPLLTPGYCFEGTQPVITPPATHHNFANQWPGKNYHLLPRLMAMIWRQCACEPHGKQGDHNTILFPFCSHLKAMCLWASCWQTMIVPYSCHSAHTSRVKTF